MKSIYVRLLTLSIILVIFIGNPNESNAAVQFDVKSGVDPYHEWTITFNDTVDPSTITEETIYIKDSNGKVIHASLSMDEANSHIVKVAPPDQGYIFDETYELYISREVKSKGQEQLKENVRMPFKIQSKKEAFDQTLESISSGESDLETGYLKSYSLGFSQDYINYLQANLQSIVENQTSEDISLETIMFMAN